MRGAVHLGVGPHGSHELGHASGGLAQLAEERAHRQRAGDPLEAGLQGGTVEQVGGAVAPLRVDARGGQGRGEVVGLGHAVVVEPVDQLVLGVAERHAPARGRAAGDLEPQLVEVEELLGTDRAAGEPAQRGQQRVAGLGHRIDGAYGGRGRVVELVGQAGCQGAESDQRLALAHGRLDRPGGPEDAPDQVHRQRQPALHQPPEVVGRHLQQPPELDAAPRGQVDAALVPGAEAAGPAAGRVHPSDPGLLAADGAEQVDGAVDEHPPVVGRLALVEQLGAGLDLHRAGDGQQLGQPLVADAGEDGQGAEVVDAHGQPPLRWWRGSGAPGGQPSRPRRPQTRPASWSRGARRPLRTLPERSSPTRTAPGSAARAPVRQPPW